MEDFSNQDDYRYEYEEDKPSFTVGQAILKYGLYLGLAIIGFNLLIFLTKMYLSEISSLIYALYITAMVFAVIEFKKKNEGFMSFGQGVGIGTGVATLGAGVIGALFYFVYINAIQPEIGQHIQEYAIEQSRKVLESFNYTEEQIEKSQEASQKFNNPMLQWFVNLLGVALLGVIFALIISAFTKKKRPLFE
ncbi:MAG TPA: hypothetical protein DCS93_22485 [Microscillaceae bacterium]|nr:hypothetical protein [Microscillaceae bacterium]